MPANSTDSYGDVFVSYRRRDGAFYTDALVNELEDEYFDVFYDKESIEFGAEFPKVIDEAIRHAKDFIAVVTPEYLGDSLWDEGDWVRKELEIALELESRGLRIIPVLFDCDMPAEGSLPREIAPIANINAVSFDPSRDKIKSLLKRIRAQFHDETVANALYGSIAHELRDIDIDDSRAFNTACKSVSRHVSGDCGRRGLESIVSSNGQEVGPTIRVPSDEIRFIAFYTLFSYYRRRHMVDELIRLVEENVDSFRDYGFFMYSLTEYHTLKAQLATTRDDEVEHIGRAVDYALRAYERLPENDGIIHSLYLTVAIALELGVAIDPVLRGRANMLIEDLARRCPNYARYFSTRARLLAQDGRYDEALRSITRAQVLEKPTHDDWSVRVASYYRDEVYIRLLARGEVVRGHEDRDRSLALLDAYLRKGDAADCEDVYGFAPPFAWVIDGATDVFRKGTIRETSEVKWYVEQLSDTIASMVGEFGDIASPETLVEKAVRKIYEEIRTPNIDETPEYVLLNFTIAMVRMVDGTLDYYVLGDCSIVYRADVSTSVITDERITPFSARNRRLLAEVRRAGGGKTEEGEVLQSTREFANRSDGYPVGSLRGTGLSQGLKGLVRIEEGTSVALYSDGLKDYFESKPEALEGVLQSGETKKLMEDVDVYYEDSSLYASQARPKKRDDQSLIIVACR